MEGSDDNMRIYDLSILNKFNKYSKFINKANSHSQLPEEKRVKGTEVMRKTSERLSGVASRPVEPLVDSLTGTVQIAKGDENE